MRIIHFTLTNTKMKSLQNYNRWIALWAQLSALETKWYNDKSVPSEKHKKLLRIANRAFLHANNCWRKPDNDRVILDAPRRVKFSVLA